MEFGKTALLLQHYKFVQPFNGSALSRLKHGFKSRWDHHTPSSHGSELLIEHIALGSPLLSRGIRLRSLPVRHAAFLSTVIEIADPTFRTFKIVSILCHRFFLVNGGGSINRLCVLRQQDAASVYSGPTSLTPLSLVVYKECAVPLFTSIAGRRS
jgi:hypothetical protein